MAVADGVIAAFVAMSALVGLVRGFVREVLSLAIWIIALMLAIGFADEVAVLLPRQVEGDSLRFILAFVLVFIGALVAGGVIQWLMTRLIQTTGLSGTDRVLGFVFGGLRGVVICILAVMVLRQAAAEQPWWQSSRAIPILSSFESDLMNAIDSVGTWVDSLRKKR